MAENIPDVLASLGRASMTTALEQKCSGGNSSTPEHTFVPDTNIKARSMVWTSFNVDNPPEWDPEKMKYLVYGAEVCPTTGKKHLQGYVYWKNERSVRAVCKQWKCWVRKAKGTPKEAAAYCKKDGNVTEFGEMPEQGKRWDLLSVKQMLIDGETTADEVCMKNPEMYHQYGRTIDKMEDICLRRKWRTEMTTCDWIVGPTGVGKSHKAFENFDPDTHYVHRLNDKGWWEGYKQQETVIINDFRGQIPYEELLNIIDKWPHYVPRRGREPMPFTSKKVIITSPLNPEEAYPRRHEKDDIAQLRRRLNVIQM